MNEIHCLCVRVCVPVHKQTFWIHWNRMTQTHFGYMQHTIRKYENQQIIVFYLVGFVGDCFVSVRQRQQFHLLASAIFLAILCANISPYAALFFLISFFLLVFLSVTVSICIHLFSDPMCSVPLFCIEFIWLFNFYRHSFLYAVHWIYEQEAIQIMFRFSSRFSSHRENNTNIILICNIYIMTFCLMI